MTDSGHALHVHPPDHDQHNQEDIFFVPLSDTVWRYRRPIGLGLAVTLAIFVALGVVLRLTLPTEQFGAISFRVDMEGAAKGEYPNGTKFSPEEIIAAPVLMGVFEANEIERYGGFSEFTSAFLVENSSPQRDALTREYQAKLVDTRLTPVDRARLEAEFQDKLNSLNAPEYRIRFRQSTSGPQLPSLLVNKVLQDTLKTWAQHASERRGALSYNIPVLSRSVLNFDEISREDYLPGVDILRTHVVRILDSLELYRAKLPGADAVRIGENHVTLEGIKASAENLQRFTIAPLSSTLIVGVSKDPASRRRYVDNQLLQIRLKRDQSNRRIVALEQSLQQQSLQFAGTHEATRNTQAPSFSKERGTIETLTPQFSESFLERLVQMSSRKEEVSYRQRLIDRVIDERFQAAELEREVAYYETLSRSVGAARMAGGSGQVPAIDARIKVVFDQLAAIMDQVVALQDQLAKNNLNPSTQLYTVTLPYTQERLVPFTLRVAALWGVALMIVAFFVLVLTALIYDRFHPATWRTPRGESLRTT